MIDEEERAAVCVHHARGGLDDEVQQPVEIALGNQRFRDFENTAESLDALLELVHDI